MKQCQMNQTKCMKLKIFTLFVAGILAVLFVKAQDPIKKKLDQLHKDPRTKERAAKADVWIVKKQSQIIAKDQKKK